MQHRSGFHKWLTLFSLRRDLTRAAIALLVLFALLLGHAPLVLVLAAPLLVYLGLWLLVPAEATDRAPRDARDSSRRSETSGVLQDVQTARDGIAGAASQMPDASSSESVERIARWIDRSLAVIAEDKKSETLAPLLELATFTNDLLARYMKLCRRGLTNTETYEQMKQNLAVIEDRFRWFWEQLNRDAIIDLAALSAAIDLFMETVPPATELGLANSAPTPIRSRTSLNGSPGESAAAPANSRDLALLATLTTKELEVLQLLAGGRTNQDIADSIFVTKNTVAKHVENILDKLGAKNRTEAAALAFRCGIVLPPERSDDEDEPLIRNA